MLDAQNQLTEKTREILRLQIKNEDLRHQLREQDEGNIQKEQQEKFENLEKEGTDMKQMLAELEKQMDALKEDVRFIVGWGGSYHPFPLLSITNLLFPI